MKIKADKVTTTEMPATIVMPDGKRLEGTALLKSTVREFQVRGRLQIDFSKLRASGDLDEASLSTLEKGYPDAPILFMGFAPTAAGSPDFCIGILTGGHVYPKNMFFLRNDTALEACVPVDEPPYEVKPY